MLELGGGFWDFFENRFERDLPSIVVVIRERDGAGPAVDFAGCLPCLSALLDFTHSNAAALPRG